MMNVYSKASLAGLKIKFNNYYHCKNTCECKVCSMHCWNEFVFGDRALYRELITHKVQKCTKQACKKFGCECGW